ncbi:cytochrome c oxidase subunit 3 [Bacteriovorax sp. PP10]|uniref:Cytochrome c oxidase subunit 3 n=1 Tax=Bacteriovorax antarcticus TaxID=3088717 RepID=A0ABU5VNF8_9BACT|nr:cytochrome c oxidase subunit 3 [Bacteriovorax sp. PP10]MEA9354579.1 cytochrome c oxidase subunit 3 [Bacteriovorax sp. PP10]
MSSHAHTHDGPKPYHEYPVDPQFKRASPGKIGMWLFLATDGMSFAGYLIAYAVLRWSRAWPNPSVALGGVELSGFMTFLLICSSVSMVLAIDACKQRYRKGMLGWLAFTIFGGIAFLSIQMYEYHHLNHAMGMSFNSYAHGDALFSSTFFAITGFHGLHVLSGVIYLIVMLVHAYRGDFDNGDYNQLEIAGLFWHFVDLVWILVFTFVYLL